MLDTSSGGIFTYRTVKEAYKLLDDMVIHHLDWTPDQEVPKEEAKTVENIAIVMSAPIKPEGDAEKLMTKFMMGQSEVNTNIARALDVHSSRINFLQKEVDFIPKLIREVCPNLVADETAEAYVTTRGGKVVQSPPMPESNLMPILQKVEPEIELPTSRQEQIPEEVLKPKETTPKPTPSRIPYPQRLRKEKKKAQYMKFIKEMVSNITKFGGERVTVLNEERSAILVDAPKKGDPGSFTIPCCFGEKVVCDALADLGASINLMPLPRHENDTRVPLILGRPFLNTADTVIHVARKQLSLGIDKERVTFSIDKAMSYAISTDDIDYMDDFDPIIEAKINDYLSNAGKQKTSS
ncbi:hypothetical protein OSB04_016947 [Centaurea solstitialis]|uniref:Uncharacterized protein n=1 Tax=Centaurea solstitialis TaxID=347529 RepID=A0AA38WA98_9ASTR|nr:hypothetical protein OSB04_016947 [Centaurea solstitialis]